MPFREVKPQSVEAAIIVQGDGRITLNKKLYETYFKDFERIRVYVDLENNLLGLKGAVDDEGGYKILIGDHWHGIRCKTIIQYILPKRRYPVHNVTNGIVIFKL